MILIILILLIALLCFKYYEMENFAIVKLNDIKIDNNTTIKIIMNKHNIFSNFNYENDHLNNHYHNDSDRDYHY